MTDIHKIAADMAEALAVARNALEPFNYANQGIELNDPDFPQHGAALRASFDWYTRSLGEGNDEVVGRESVRRSDIAWAAKAYEAVRAALAAYEAHKASVDRATDKEIEAIQPCGIAGPSTRDCPNMKEVGGGMDGERYHCAVCGKGYYLDYEDMK